MRMIEFGVVRRVALWLAGLAMLPALAVAQTTPGAPQTDPSLDRFSLPPSARPTPRPIPTSGPIIAPFSRPTPAAPIILTPPTPTPTPQPRATTPPPVRTPVAARTPSVAATPVRRPDASPTVVPTSAPVAAPVAPTPEATAAPAQLASPSPEATASTPAPTGEPAAGLSTGWLIAIGAALLALVALGGYLLGRRRSGREREEYEDAEASVPEPVVDPPVPAPAHVTVPTRRPVTDEPAPRLEIVLIPKRAGTNLMSAAVDYRVIVRNTGPVAARDVRFAMYMLSSSARQAQDLQTIFAAPIERPVVQPFELAPGQDVELSGMAMLARDQVNVMTIDGKPWFVPVLAMKAEYRWGDNVGAPGVATAAHMIGIDRGEGAKMAPFRLDGGPHMHPEVTERKVA